MKTITLTMKEQKRVEVIQRVFREELRMTEAGRVLGVSERQTFRIKARVKKGGHKVNPNRLEQTLCFKYQRVVAKDNTVGFKGSVFQIPK